MLNVERKLNNMEQDIMNKMNFQKDDEFNF